MIWKRQQAEPGYEFDTPVPQNETRAQSVVTDDLASSIGELAPDGLK